MGLRDIRTPQTYMLKLGIPTGSATAWLHNRNASLRLEQLEKLCIALNCTPNDLFRWKGDGSDLPAGHELRKLVRADEVLDLAARLKALSPEEAEQLLRG